MGENTQQVQELYVNRPQAECSFLMLSILLTAYEEEAPSSSHRVLHRRGS